jgi:hypothetical protein
MFKVEVITLHQPTDFTPSPFCQMREIMNYSTTHHESGFLVRANYS